MLVRRTYSETKWSSCIECISGRHQAFIKNRTVSSCVVIKVQLLHSCLGKRICLYVIRLTCCAEDGKRLVASFTTVATQTVDFSWRSLELQLISRGITEPEQCANKQRKGQRHLLPCSVLFFWFIDACINRSELCSEAGFNQRF